MKTEALRPVAPLERDPRGGPRDVDIGSYGARKMSRSWAARGPPHRCIQAWGPEGGLWASVSTFDG